MQDLQQKEVDLFQPILEKARTAIQKVARAQGFQYVLDASQGTGVILSDGKDLLADVKKELGI
jgi:outer membrane protein